MNAYYIPVALYKFGSETAPRVAAITLAPLVTFCYCSCSSCSYCLSCAFASVGDARGDTMLLQLHIKYL